MRVTASRIDTSGLKRAATIIRRALPLAIRQDILAKGLRPVAELMRENAPKDSGKSADAIGIEVLEAENPNDAVVAVGVGQKGFPLRFNETGTENQPARPVIRPTWESSAEAFKAGVARDVAAAVKGAL